METAFAELPLALFTTLAPMGAGAFVALALAFCTTKFDDAQLKKIDLMTIIPLIVIAVGFVASFFHLASPLNAMHVFSGVGSSPLSNEILVGCLFVVLALVYWILALTGKLAYGARKVGAVIVGAAALVFALFTGMAYVMDTIASWNSPLVPIQMLGFALVGGMSLGMLVLSLADVLADACRTSFKRAAVGVTVAGVLVAAVAFCVQIMGVSSMGNALVSGADLVAGVIVYMVIAVVCLVVAALAVVFALRGTSQTGLVVTGVVLSAAGIFIARLVFYAVELSVGLYF